MKTRAKQYAALTLVEMLVVLAVIALLLAVLVPTTNLIKPHAGIVACLSNQRQLYMAWGMYYTDNDGRLVGGSNYFNNDPVPQPTPWRWAEKPLYNDTDNPEVDAIPDESEYCLDYRINGIRAGKLYKYLDSEKVYHCAQDRTCQKLGEPYAVYRSYAIAGLMNGEDFVSRAGGLYTDIDEYSYAFFPGGQIKTLVCVTRFNEIQAPAQKYVFVEEKIDGRQTYNRGSFMMMVDAQYTSWWDYPADFHGPQSTLGFADGHVERHKWTDPRTLELVEKGWDDVPLNQPNNEDQAWMLAGYIPKP